MFASDGGLIHEQGGATEKAEDVYEGLPLVRLVGDEGEDVAHILRAIYERHYYDRNDDNTPLNIILALLTLSTKYDFKHIRKDVFIQISNHYPMALEDRDLLATNMPLFGVTRGECDDPLLLAAFTVHAECLLPTLFLSSSDCEIEVLFDTCHKIPQCKLTMIKGRMHFDLKLAELVAGLPEDSLQAAETCACPRDPPCLKTARYTNLPGLLNITFSDTRGKFVVRDNLSPVCETCSSFVGERIEEKRNKIWNEVPSFFGLPGWDVLQARLKEIIEP